MKKLLAVVIAAVMVITICMGTAFAKKDTNNGKGNSDKPKATQEIKKNDNDKSNKNSKGSKTNDKKTEAQKKKELKNQFKAAVTPYLDQIKANKRAWGQAGGLDELEGMKDNIEDMLESILAGNIPVTSEQLAAISAEIQNIKALKDSLRADKSTMNTEWHKYIKAKKTYDIAAATAALQNVINLQKKRIDARKGIFSSLGKIAAIIKEVLATPPAPAPTTTTTPVPTTTPEPAATPTI
jgi:hypothetical protein